ncbi:hypothetical protein NU219Hw_g4773t1 [Hortaea werneckii]
MEHQDDQRHAELNRDGDGFTMEFKIDVVDDIEAQVEEMMRLGALGYFKEARQLSQSIAPVHQQKFEVVFEQLRLMLDQGAYTDLIERAESYHKDAYTPMQSTLLKMMIAIARISMSSTEDSQALEFLRGLQHIDPLLLCERLQQRLIDQLWTTEELLEVVLLLRLWYLGQIHELEPTTSLDEKKYACLIEGAFFLLEQEQYWAAEMMFQSAFARRLFDSVTLRDPYPWINVMEALERLEKVDESTFEGRLTKMTVAQIILEGIVMHQYIASSRGLAIASASVIRTRLSRLQAHLERRLTDEDYGPRLAMRCRFIGLLDGMAIVLGRGSNQEISRVMEEVHALQTQARHYEDRAMYSTLELIT